MVHSHTTFPRLDWMFIASLPLCKIMHADFSPVEEVSRERREKKGMLDADIFGFYET